MAFLSNSSTKSSSLSCSSSSQPSSNSSSIILNDSSCLDSPTSLLTQLSPIQHNVCINSKRSSCYYTSDDHSNDTTLSSSGYCGSTSSSNDSPVLVKEARFILNAFVNGFVQLKLCADKIDFEYIIEIYWSDTSKTFIKRTYDDFVMFHRKLSELCRVSDTQSQLPSLPGKKPFWTSNLKIAEQREVQLNQYVQRIVKLPIKISQNTLIVEFFQTKTCDPKPACKKQTITNRRRSSQHFDFDHTTSSSPSYLNSINHHHQHNYNQIDSFENDLSSLNEVSTSYHARMNDYVNNDDDENISNNNNDNQSTGVNNYKINLNRDYYEKTNLFMNINSNFNKSSNEEEGLWWDEDNALTNELTLCSRANDFDDNNIESMLDKLEFEDNI